MQSSVLSPSLDETLPEYVISQEDNSPLTLYIVFQFFFFFLVISSPFDKVHVKMCVHSIRQLYCCDITDIKRVPPERATYTKLMKPLKNHIFLLDYPNLPKLLLLCF